MQIRTFTIDDLSAVMSIQSRCPQAAQWQESDYLRLASEPGGILLVAENQNPAARTKWVEAQAPRTADHAPTAADRGLTTNNTPTVAPIGNRQLAGFCAFHQVLDEAELRNLAVAPAHQRAGIAKALLEEAHWRLLQAGARRVYLEVRVSNLAARRLYHALGYRSQSTRKDYYHTPVEDAERMLFELRRM